MQPINIIEGSWKQGVAPKVVNLTGTAFMEEAGAHTFRIHAQDETGAETAFTGTVTALFLRADNTTVALDGSLSGGAAVVTLVSDCYHVAGRFSIAVYVSDGTDSTCVYAAVGNVYRTSSDVVIDSGAEIPTLAQLQAAYAACVEATEDAESAAAIIDRVEDVTTTHPASAGANLLSHTIKVGEWYRFMNNGSALITLSILNGSTTVQNCGALIPGETVYAKASANGDAFRFYALAADSGAEVVIAEGDAISPQNLDGCFYMATYSPRSAQNTDYLYTVESGRWYRFQNKGASKFNVSVKSGGSTVQHMGALLPGATMYAKATANGDTFSLYAYSADNNAKVYIATGDIVSPGSLDGCYSKWLFSPSGTATYRFQLEKGKAYKITNNGTKTVTIRSKISGTVKEVYGDVAAGGSMFFVPTADCNQLDLVYASADSSAAVYVYAGEIIEAQAGASKNAEGLAQAVSDISSVGNAVAQNKRAFEMDRWAGFVRYAPPGGFTWTDSPVAGKVYTNGRGEFRVDYSVMDQISTAGLDVYVAPDGNDTNDGLTEATPKKTLSAAIGITNARRVHIAGGHYPRQVFTGSSKIAKDIDLIGDPDNRPVFTAQDAAVSWTATAVAGVYTTAHKNNAFLFDLTTIVSGFYRAYTEESGTAGVEANAGTYYDDGTTVTIHTFDGSEPTLANTCYTQKRSAVSIATAGHQILMANLCFTCGGTYSSEGQLMVTGDSSLRGTFLIYNCDSSYGTRPTITPGTPPSGGGFMTSYADAVIQECSAYYAGNDGFSYGSSSKVVEIDCVSAFNGVSEATSCNGSTAHGGSYIRINGAYHDTHGPVVHDVGATESVNLGLAAWHSTCEDKPNFCASGGAVTMWLDSCVGYSSDAGIDVGKPDESAPNAVIYKRNCTSDVADGEYGGHIYRY